MLPEKSYEIRIALRIGVCHVYWALSKCLPGVSLPSRWSRRMRPAAPPDFPFALSVVTTAHVRNPRRCVRLSLPAGCAPQERPRLTVAAFERSPSNGNTGDTTGCWRLHAFGQPVLRSNGSWPSLALRHHLARSSAEPLARLPCDQSASPATRKPVDNFKPDRENRLHRG